MRRGYADLEPPKRLLLGPGPANVDPRVLRAISLPVVGFLDSFFTELMEDIKELLRYVFRTRSDHTFPIAGTGTAGMETAIFNVVEPGDEVIVGVNGYFGARIAEVVGRAEGKALEVREEWGKPVSKEKLEEALEGSNAKVIALVHGETSTGVLQPLIEAAELARQYDALLLVDAVSSLGGCELETDAVGIDVCYSCSQKCLGCPPGLAPITFSEKAFNVVLNRKTKVRSLYLDITMVEKYWSRARRYHHTPPINMFYGFREALRIIYEEGIDNRWARHRRVSNALVRGIEAMGLEPLVAEEYRLPSLTTVKVPSGTSEEEVRRRLLDDYRIEIGKGLGELEGKIWRIGMMGYNATEQNVIYALHALEQALASSGYKVERGAGVSAALEYLSSAKNPISLGRYDGGSQI